MHITLRCYYLVYFEFLMHAWSICWWRAQKNGLGKRIRSPSINRGATEGSTELDRLKCKKDELLNFRQRNLLLTSNWSSLRNRLTETTTKEFFGRTDGSSSVEPKVLPRSTAGGFLVDRRNIWHVELLEFVVEGFLDQLRVCWGKLWLIGQTCRSIEG